MQHSRVPRRPRRWLRLAALIAGIGALAVLGAALGHGLGAFDAGNAQARATTPTPVAVAALAAAPASTATPAPPAASLTPGRGKNLSPTPAPTSGESASGSPSPRLGDQRSAGDGLARASGSDTAPSPQPAARLPQTGGDDVVLGLGALGIVLYLAGVALFVVPHMVARKQQEKE